MIKISGIYKITSPSGKIYIGQSSNIESRMKYYRLGHCKHQTILYRSLQKYGWFKHKFEVIKCCKETDLSFFEKYFINKYNTFENNKGMNLTEGGDNSRHSNQTKINISIAKKAKHFHHTIETKEKIRRSKLGSTQSKETILKRSLAMKGKPSPMKNRKHSKETKIKMSKAQKGKILTNSHKENIRKVVLQYWKINKKPDIKRNCKCCNKEFTVSRKHKETIHCSRKCQGKTFSQKYNNTNSTN